MPEYDAQGKETGRVLLTLDWLGELGWYIASTQDWIEAAAGCLEAKQ